MPSDRNKPCPCGSDLKYKKCHGKNVSKGPSVYKVKPRTKNTGISRVPIPIIDPRSMAGAGMMTLAAVAARSQMIRKGKEGEKPEGGQEQSQ